ncbi:hypothetical protein DYB32_008566 [Aphanomyces invadans]|uniref:Uncharacterized protein n=1 Tax=Aphanomyces invadans TaxID=157072 RepID=A0A418AKW0_9STRA|nr:hypothetical protein DYB32_008566 [Aphanomyces invadans]
MFVVKDLRKVAEIVADPKDAREQMRLGRRVLSIDKALPVLSLDNNQLEDVADEIGQCVDLVELNVRAGYVGRELQRAENPSRDIGQVPPPHYNPSQREPDCLFSDRAHSIYKFVLSLPCWRLHSWLRLLDLRVNLANTAITTFDVEVASKWRVLSHLHITAKESTPSDDTSVLIVSGTPYAKLAMAKK